MRGFKFFGSIAAIGIVVYFVLNLPEARVGGVPVLVLFGAAWLMWQAYRRWAREL